VLLSGGRNLTLQQFIGGKQENVLENFQVAPSLAPSAFQSILLPELGANSFRFHLYHQPLSFANDSFGLLTYFLLRCDRPYSISGFLLQRICSYVYFQSTKILLNGNKVFYLLNSISNRIVKAEMFNKNTCTTLVYFLILAYSNQRLKIIF
jgi:hypothetical protein